MHGTLSVVSGFVVVAQTFWSGIGGIHAVDTFLEVNLIAAVMPYDCTTYVVLLYSMTPAGWAAARRAVGTGGYKP